MATKGSSGQSSTGPVKAIETALITVVRQARRPGVHEGLGRRAGVSLARTETLILARIADAEPIGLSALAAEVDLDLSVVSRHVSALVDAGLVDRSRSDSDGRAVELRLTADGNADLERIRRARREWIARLVSEWPGADIETLAELLERFATAMAHATPDGEARSPAATGGSVLA